MKMFELLFKKFSNPKLQILIRNILNLVSGESSKLLFCGTLPHFASVTNKFRHETRNTDYLVTLGPVFPPAYESESLWKDIRFSNGGVLAFFDPGILGGGLLLLQCNLFYCLLLPFKPILEAHWIYQNSMWMSWPKTMGHTNILLMTQGFKMQGIGC